MIERKDISTTDYTTTKSGNTKVEYIHKDLALDKNLPHHFSRTNTVDRSKFVNIRHENDIEQKRNKPIASFSSQNFRDIKGILLDIKDRI